MIVGFGRKRGIMPWISLNIINTYNWSSTKICLACYSRLCYCSKAFAASPWGSVIFPALLTSCLAFNLLWLMKYEWKWLMLTFEQKLWSQNTVSCILFFSLLWQSADLNRHFSITLRSEIKKTCSWAIANPCLTVSMSKK